MQLQQPDNVTPLILIETIESKLIKMKKLSQKIKELQAEYGMIKDEVVKNYFVDHEEYKTSKGLLLAKYSMQTRTSFNSTKFKADFPDIYAGYQEESAVYTFLLK